MAKKKKAERAIKKAVTRALHKGVSKKVVGKVVEKAINGGAEDNATPVEVKKKKTKAESAGKKPKPATTE